MTDEELKAQFIAQGRVTVCDPAFAQGYTPPDGFLAQLTAAGLAGIQAYNRSCRFNILPAASLAAYRNRKKKASEERQKYTPIEWGDYALGRDAKRPPRIDPHVKVAAPVRVKPVMTPKGRFPSAKAAGEAFGFHKSYAAQKARLKEDGWHYCA